MDSWQKSPYFKSRGANQAGKSTKYVMWTLKGIVWKSGGQTEGMELGLWNFHPFFVTCIPKFRFLKFLKKCPQKKLLKKNPKILIIFFSKMRSAKILSMALPFEIERSNFMCVQRKGRCKFSHFHFFQIPYHFCARNSQSSVIFKSANFGHVSNRLLMLKIAYAKKKNEGFDLLRNDLLYRKNISRSFLSQKNRPKNVRP